MLEKIYRKKSRIRPKEEILYIYIYSFFPEMQHRVPTELLKYFGALKGTVILHTAPFGEVISLM